MILFSSLVRLSTDSLNETLINKGALSIMVIHISILLLYRPDDVDGCHRVVCPSYCSNGSWASICHYCQSKPVECPSCCKDGCKLPECALPQCKPKPVEHRGDYTRDWWWRRPRWGCPSCCKWGCFHIFCVLPQCRRVWG